MMALDNYELRINRIIDRYGELLLKNPNIVGIGRGLKTIKGNVLSEPTLTFFVKKKLPYNNLHPSMVIPKFIMGASSDVIQRGESKPCDLRPAYGGGAVVDRLAPGFIRSATLSYALTDKEKKNIYFLENAHFLDMYNKGDIGIKIYYAKTEKTRSSDYFLLGETTKVIPIKNVDVKDTSKYNEIDAGIGLVGPNTEEERKKFAPGLIDGTIVPGTTSLLTTSLKNKQISVYRIGAKTGRVSGKIITVNTLEKARFGNFKSQIVVNMKSEGGDSGALGVLENSGLAFGMLMSGTADGFSVFNDIDKILKIFDLQLLQPNKN